MAKTNTLLVDNINLMDTAGKIDWSRMKNTPDSLVTGSGHNHDITYYSINYVNNIFNIQEDRLSLLEADIETLSYKTDFMMGGGGSSANTAIHNYNNTTEVFSTITPTLHTPTLNAPGISTSSSGYFFSDDSYSTNKIDYFTLVVEVVNNCPILTKGSLIDFAVQSKGFITDGVQSWAELNILLDIWKTKENSISGASNQVLLSSFVEGFTKSAGNTMIREYKYSSSVSRDINVFNTNGDTVGLCQNSNKGLWLSSVGYNLLQVYKTDTVSVFNGMINNTVGSSTCTTEYFGVVASGSNSTTVQKVTWSTLSISNMTNISIDKTGATSVEI